MSMIKCPECGKEISDNALACPNCGYQLHKKKKGYLPLAIIGTILSVLEVFGMPLYLVGLLLCIISIVLSLKKKKQYNYLNITPTIIICIIGIVLAVYTTVVSIINNVNISNNVSNNKNIIVDGIFKLDPDNSDMIENPLDNNTAYIIVVYGLKNPSNTNKKLEFISNSIQLQMGDNNYEQKDSYIYEEELYSEFVMASGYKTSQDLEEVSGGTSNPIRMMETFAVNKNDFESFDEGKIKWNLSNDYKLDKKFKVNSIKNIQMFDGIFEVEDNPDDYQIARSLYSRAKSVEYYIDSAIAQANNGNMEASRLNISLAQKMFEQGMWIEYKEEGGIISSDAPAYNSSAIKKELPELYDCANNLEQNVDEIAELFDSLLSNPSQTDADKIDQDVVNVDNLCDKIYKYFES